MAARGTRNLDHGEESFDDADLSGQLRGKAQRINRRALITAAAITLLTLVYP